MSCTSGKGGSISVEIETLKSHELEIGDNLGGKGGGISVEFLRKCGERRGKGEKGTRNQPRSRAIWER